MTDTEVAVKRVTDAHLNAITSGIRRRVNKGKSGGELFARSHEEWFGRVLALADAVKAGAAQRMPVETMDAAASLCAACYFATAPETTDTAD